MGSKKKVNPFTFSNSTWVDDQRIEVFSNSGVLLHAVEHSLICLSEYEDRSTLPYNIHDAPKMYAHFSSAIVNCCALVESITNQLVFEIVNRKKHPGWKAVLTRQIDSEGMVRVWERFDLIESAGYKWGLKIAGDSTLPRLKMVFSCIELTCPTTLRYWSRMKNLIKVRNALVHPRSRGYSAVNAVDRNTFDQVDYEKILDCFPDVASPSWDSNLQRNAERVFPWCLVSSNFVQNLAMKVVYEFALELAEVLSPDSGN